MQELQTQLVDCFPKNWFDQDITYGCNIDISTYSNSRIEQIFKELKPINHSLRHYLKPNKIAKKARLISELENIMRRFYFDQTVYDDNKNIIVEPIARTRKVDRVAIQGMGRMASIFAGESRGFYDWMINGGSDLSAEVTDWRLYQEFATASIQDSGYSSGSGTVVKHGAAFSINDETNTIKEVAARDFPIFNADQTVWFRSVLDFNAAGDEIEHIKGKDVVIISHAAHFISVSDFEEQVEQQVI